MNPGLENVGLVIIGRNEGERLKKCIASVLYDTDKIIYVDSGSNDGSVEYMESINIKTINLDTSIPFSAGRARNEGAADLVRTYPEVEFIQFVDGDCELSAGWLKIAEAFLKKDNSSAIVAGRTKEQFPEKSIYNLLCDIEWNIPSGYTDRVGGIFMIRKTAFENSGGFNPSVIAGEEPELCYRLRRNNWQIYRIDNVMVLHDAAMTLFSQWYKRTLRSGHAYIQGYILHRKDNNKYCLKDLQRIWFWTFVYPVSLILLAGVINYSFLALFIIYPVQVLRIALYKNKTINNLKHSIIYGFFITIGRWPQFLGQFLFLKRKILKKQFKIIE